MLSEQHSGRYRNMNIKFINHHNPDLVLLADDGTEVMRVDLTRLSSTTRIHRLLGLLGMDEICSDVDQNCAGWSASGECVRNPKFMEMSCRKSCGFCSPGSSKTGKACMDADPHCATWSSSGECVRNRSFMKDKCRKSCDFCSTELTADDLPTCRDKEKPESCEYWYTMGECTVNEAFMREQCAMSCGFCESENARDEEDKAADDGKDEL